MQSETIQNAAKPATKWRQIAAKPDAISDCACAAGGSCANRWAAVAEVRFLRDIAARATSLDLIGIDAALSVSRSLSEIPRHGSQCADDLWPRIEDQRELLRREMVAFCWHRAALNIAGRCRS